MASRSRIDCPLCHELLDYERSFEQHLTRDHRKDELVEFVVTETMAMEDEEVSE